MIAERTEDYAGGRAVSADERPPIPPYGIRCRGECGQVHPPEAVPFMFTTQRRQVSVHDVRVHRVQQRRLGPLEWTNVCNSCLQTRYDRKKREGNGRLREKARKMVERHRVTFSDWVGREITPGEMRSEYLYETGQIVHDLEHALKNGCCWCGDSYEDMGHGTADIQLDVDDPKRHRAEKTVPVYGHDARLCCRTCNTKKQDLSREEWRQVCISFKKQRSYQTEMALQPPSERYARLSFLDSIGFHEMTEGPA